MNILDNHKTLFASLFVALLAAAPAVAQFQPGYAKPGTTGGPVEDLFLFDAGGGEQLYAYGNFFRLDGEPMTGIVQWKSSRWVPTSMTNPGSDLDLRDMRVLDLGAGPRLFAYGKFNEIFGVQAKDIAFWDGSTWAPFGHPTSTPFLEARGLFVYDDGGGPALFVAGAIAHVDSYIWKWDGSDWAVAVEGVLASGFQVWDDGGGEKVFAWGRFSESGEKRLFSWDGSTIEILTQQPFDELAGMAVTDLGDGERLYMLGKIDSGDHTNDPQRLVSFDGATWRTEFEMTPPGFSSLGGMTPYDLGDGARLGFTGAPAFGTTGIVVSTAYSWDGTTLRELTTPEAEGYGGISGALDAAAGHLVPFDDGSGPALYSGGAFRLDGVNAVQQIARWRGAGWEGVSRGGLRGLDLAAQVYALEPFDLGDGEKLYAGGVLHTAGDAAVYGVAAFDGTSWSAIIDPAGPLWSYVYALELFDSGDGPRLVAGGSFFRRTSPELCRLAEWDGAAWQPILSVEEFCGGLDQIEDLVTFDDGTGEQLIAVGTFGEMGSVSYDNVLAWDGTTLSPLAGRFGFGTDGAVHAAAVFDDGNGPSLYIGGAFGEAGGVLSPFLARWDGGEWWTVGSDLLDGPVEALEVFDDGSGPALYLGGSFSQVGSLAVNGIARWDGQAFSALAGEAGVGVGVNVEVGTSPRVWALRAVDAGDGERLYVAGAFDTAGGLTSPDLAIWDGGWSAPEGATAGGFGGGQPPYALAGFDDGSGPSLFVGGQFQTIYGESSVGVGEYQVDPLLFVDGFESGDTSAWSAP